MTLDTFTNTAIQDNTAWFSFRLRFTAVRTLLPLVVLLACQGNTQLSSPVISVDLRHKLPAHLQRLVLTSDPSYPCQQSFQISTDQLNQHFLAVWKVLEQGDSRFITAVQVDPDGPISGGTTPVASAMLGEATIKQLDGTLHQVTPLRVTLRAEKGCHTLEASTSLKLATDFGKCQKPQQPKVKLLTPVD